MDNRPRLLALSQCTQPNTKSNVLVIGGLPWHVSENRVAQHLLHVYPEAEPITTRIYDNPVNGVSRGFCFVEYPAQTTGSATGSTSGAGDYFDAAGAAWPVDLTAVKAAVEAAPLNGAELTATLYFLTVTRWDRGGKLPDLPTDPPPLRRGQYVGFGEEGFTTRYGPLLGLPNTVAPSGAAKLRALRKRMRAEVTRRHRPSSSSSGSDDDDGEEEA